MPDSSQLTVARPPLATSPLVSVVTPVYNGAEYLAECIESVLAQTYGHFEYLIVDNCSSDATQQVAERYAARDSRIRYHRCESYREVIANWNRALTLVSPDAAYCKMVLADDWLGPECLEWLVAILEAHPEAAVAGSYRKFGDEVDLDVLPPSSCVFDGQEVARTALAGGRFLFGTPTTLLFRADAVRARGNEFFDEARLPGEEPPPDGHEVWVNYHADTDVVYVLLQEGDWGFAHQVLSFTRLHEETITSRWTTDRGTWLPGHLYITLKNGPALLDPAALRRRVRELQRRYSVALTKALLSGRLLRDPVYGAYHREALRRLRILSNESAARSLGPALLVFSGLLSTFLGGRSSAPER